MPLRDGAWVPGLVEAEERFPLLCQSLHLEDAPSDDDDIFHPRDVPSLRPVG